MGVLPIVVLSAVCLISLVAAEDGANCYYEGITYKDGETVTGKCLICECVNGEIKECLSVVNCDDNTPLYQDQEDINYNDEPDVFGSSDNTPLRRKKRSANMSGKSMGSSNIAAGISVGGGSLGLESSKKVMMSSSSSSSSDVKSSVGKDTTIIGNLPNQLPKADVKVNASLQVGGSTGLGVQGGVGIKEYDEEEKRIQAELRKISEQKQSSAGVSVAVAERGGKIIQQEATSGEKKENSDGIQLGNLQLGGSLGHQSGQTIHISGQQEIQGGFEKSTVENRGKNIIDLNGGKTLLSDLNVGGAHGQQSESIKIGNSGELNGKGEINGGLEITSNLNKEGGKHIIDLSGSKTLLSNINVGGAHGQQSESIKIGNSGELNGKGEINGGLEITSNLNKEGGKHIIDLSGSKTLLSNLNVGSTHGQQSQSIKIGNSGELNGKGGINGGLEITSNLNKEGGKHIIDLSGSKTLLSNLNVGGAHGQQSESIKIGNSGEVNGKGEINGGLEITSNLYKEGGKHIIDLSGSETLLSNINVGGAHGQQSESIKIGNSGEVNGKGEINGGLEITSNLNKEGGKHIIDLSGSKTLLSNLNVGGAHGQQSESIKLGNSGELNGKGGINGGLEITSNLYKEGGKHIINLSGSKTLLSNINVGGAHGQQSESITIGNSGELNGKGEINGGLEITSNLNKEGGKHIINLSGSKTLLSNLNVGGAHGQQSESIKIGNSGELNGKGRINGGLEITSNLYKEGGKHIIDLSGRKTLLSNINVGGAHGQQSESIKIGNSGELNGKGEINGGLEITSNLNKEGGKRIIDLSGSKTLLSNLNVGGAHGQQSESIKIGNSGELNGKGEINGGLEITSNLYKEAGKQIINVRGGKLKSSNLRLGGALFDQTGKTEFGNSGETQSFEINGKNVINGGLKITSDLNKQERKTVGFGVIGKKKSGNDDSSEDNNGSKKSNINVEGNLNGRVSVSHETSSIGIESGKHVNINVNGGGKDSSGDISKEVKGTINVGGKIGQNHVSGEANRKIDINIKRGHADHSEEDSSEEDSTDGKKGTIKVGGRIGQNHGSGEANRKIDINIKKAHTDHSEEDSSEGKKGTIKVGGKSGQNHVSGEANRKIDINIKRGHADHSEEDSSEEDSSGGKKGTIKVGGKSGQNHVSGEANRKIDINIKRGHTDHSEEDSSEEDSTDGKKGTIKVGGKIGQNHVSGEANRKIDINIKKTHTDHSEKDSSEEDSTDGKKGTIKVGGKSGQNHVSGEANRKIDINIKRGHTDHSEEDSSEEDSSSGKKGSINVGGKIVKNHGSKEQNEKIHINIKGGSSEQSKEDNSGENKGTSKSAKHESSKENKENDAKSSFEDVDLDIGILPTYSPDFTIESMIIPQTAHLLFQGNRSRVTEDVERKQNEPKEPVNPPKPVEPKEPVNPPKPVEPKEPVTPSKPAKPEEPNPATVPSSRESCTFNTNSVPHGWTAELDCASCTCNDGDLTCVKKLSCSGICSVTGFQMIRTFDGTLYESPGDCSYILVKTPDFTISLSNALCSELGGNKYDEHAVCIKSVDIYIPSKANLRLLYTGEILASGEATTLPYSILDTITVLRSSSTFLDVASPLFNLQYDFNLNRLYVILEVSYKGQTSGLCGTYNDNRNDDYRSSNDITETVSSFFSKSWKTQYQCSESKQQPEDNDRKVNADVICTDALESSIFEDCTLLIDIHSYKSSCVNSFYNNEEIGLCSALADYAYHCAQAGIFVPVSSSFPDCSPVCEGEMVFATENTFSQQDCAEFTSTLRKITSSLPLNEACVCPPDLYYDSSLNACVPGDSCPCYNNNRLYKIGETITQANGQTCPCERLLQCGDEEEPPADVEDCSEHEVYSDCFVGTGKACEPTCNNLALFDQGCTLPCQPGCICKSGLLRNNNGDCVPLNQCPCMHGDDIYNAGETLAQGCNTCTCENGKFSCTTNPCNKVCNAYGGSQFLLFDDVWKTFATRDCAIVLVESRKGESPFFKVVMRNDANEALGGALLKKKIYIGFGGASVLLSEFDTTVVHELGSTTQLRTYRSGFYVVVHFLEGLTVYYDQHLDVIIQLEPQLQGKVQGMCGDADGTTTSEQAINNMAQYASQFLVDECPNHEATKPPPTDNQKKFVEERCNLLKSEDFSECHTVVNVDPYYTACVEETESCREGESCLCYCTSLAAYARACCRKGITIEWRSPDTCPSPCEYYNRDSGKGPYRLLMMNSKTLVVDYDHQTVSLDTVDTTGNLKASFMVTPSLYVDPQNGRKLISLESAEHHNYFIVQNDDGSLSLQKWQPSVEFRRKATFVLRPDRWVKGFNALESFLARGQYLSLDGDELVMSKVKTANMLQMSFQLIEETFGLPSFSICTWKYRACGNPCIPTCQDPLGTKCTLTLKVEGCYPMCAPGMVFDEVTNRCVQLEDCITVAIGTTPAPAEICTHVTCKVDPCAEGEYLQEVPSTDPCCPQYICLVLSTLPPLITTPECKNVKCKVDSCAHGEYLQQIDTKDRCCPHFVCIGTTTPIPKVVTKESCKDVICTVKKCSKGQYLQQVSTSDPCCPSYECIEHPTVVAPTKTTIPQSNESCENVLCEPPARCTKNGAVLVEVQWADDCCPHYKCQCEVDCKPPPTCRDSVLPLRIGNPDVDCCPTYVCIYQPPTSAPASTIKKDCEDISCTVIDCDKNSRLVEVPSENPCCQAYECVPIVTTTPSPPSCDKSSCDVAHCASGDKVLVKDNPGDPCCPLYECVSQKTTTAPPVWVSTTDVCDKVVCKTVECLMKGSRKVLLSIEGCCPTYDCECDPCSPPPFCDGDKPIMRIDPEHECCPTYTCPSRSGFKPSTPTPTPPKNPVLTTPSSTPDLCKNVVCEPVSCDKGSNLQVVEWGDRCCPHFVCEPVPPTSCEEIICHVPVCRNGEKLIVKTNSDDPCCPLYDCIKPPTPPPTPGSTTVNVKCEDHACPVVDCFRKGSFKEFVGGNDPCCPEFRCVCQPCSPVPNCGDFSPMAEFDPDRECCPTYTCPTPAPQIKTTTPLITTPPTPTDICKNVLCEPVVCTKKGATVKASTWADQCCPRYTCECSEFCDPPPKCEDGSPAVRTQDPESYCCPEYECRTPTTTPSTTTTKSVCDGVTCTVPSCGADSTLIEVYTDDPCCRTFECLSHTTTPTPPPEICTDSKCDPANCDEDATVIVKPNPDNECCSIYECRYTTTPSPTTTTTPGECSDVVCTVKQCTKEGESPVFVGWENHCCGNYECQCEPCKPSPYCDGDTPIVKIDTDTQCCPSYECPNRSAPPTPLSTTPSNTCKNVLCEPVVCAKQGATVEITGWANDCCPRQTCECTESCDPPPVCKDGSPPVRTQDFESYCCPEYECRTPTTTPPTTTTRGVCNDVTCTVPTCAAGSTLVEVFKDDPCCKTFECLHPPPKPTPPKEPCIEAKCDPANCDEDATVIVKSNPDNECCPIYECKYTTTPSPLTTPEECSDVVCTVKECTKEGETLVFVGWENHCCGNFECQCEPCHPPPYCNGQIPLASINTDRECCPTYECPIPPTPPPELPSTTILHTTSRSITCVNRVCAPKICKEHEKLVTRINPSDPCCPIQTCECSCDTIPACADDEQLVAVQQSKQCCPKLKCERKRDECHIVPIHVNIKSGKCSAKVILSSCSGYCHSSTKYSKFWTPVSQCRCCSVTETRPKTFELPCSDGTKVHKTVHEATQCGCNTCSEDEGIPSGYHSGDHSGSGSGSGDEGSGFTMWSPFEYRNSI